MKLLPIANCWECKHPTELYNEDDYDYVCTHPESNGLRLNQPLDGIPKECPLDNYIIKEDYNERRI